MTDPAKNTSNKKAMSMKEIRNLPDSHFTPDQPNPKPSRYSESMSIEEIRELSDDYFDGSETTTEDFQFSAPDNNEKISEEIPEELPERPPVEEFDEVNWSAFNIKTDNGKNSQSITPPPPTSQGNNTERQR